ncbi:hypothetical protein MBELCI_3342 [Limimaricola cinnabarinus LL-001]|uniref:Uncharacterized protein n=1 Tax=Limimaricola cinnabarinus LL-001 TaxID=1337093 RepID=U2Z785_9RHOB|nr:hypothetical protein MBELCI_3342 [Limimaricola cinnabarinus LL-001]
MRIQPGAMALTRIPSFAQAMISDLVNCAMLPFEAELPGTHHGALR